MSTKYIIIGNGITGITAAKSILANDKDCNITMFGSEKFYPYNRVRLSKGLLTSLEEDKILLQKKDWYADNNITLYTDTKVKSIDAEGKKILCSCGKTLDYDKLLIATGSKNFQPSIPGIDSKGVFTLKTLSDAWDIMEFTKAIKTFLIIGGGIQGLETAWILSQMGKEVILAELQPRLMPKQLDQIASDILLKSMEKFNIKVLLDTQIASIEGDELVNGFTTDSGSSMHCDGVIYSIGTRPNISFIQGDSILSNRGVIVDKHMRTSSPDVFAAGDVAELNGAIPGLWNIAIEQGKIAGLNMTGKNETYKNVVPVTRLSAFEKSLFSMGDVSDENAQVTLVEEDLEKGTYNKIFFRDDLVVGAIMIGDIKSSPLLKGSIENEFSLKDTNYKDVCIPEFLEILKSIKKSNMED